MNIPKFGLVGTKGHSRPLDFEQVANCARSLLPNLWIGPLSCRVWRDEGILMHWPSCTYPLSTAFSREHVHVADFWPDWPLLPFLCACLPCLLRQKLKKPLKTRQMYLEPLLTPLIFAKKTKKNCSVSAHTPIVVRMSRLQSHVIPIGAKIALRWCEYAQGFSNSALSHAFAPLCSYDVSYNYPLATW